MATSRILLSFLRRSRHLSSVSAFSPVPQSLALSNSHLLSSPYQHRLPPSLDSLQPFYFSLSRFFSVQSEDGSEFTRLCNGDDSAAVSIPHLDSGNVGFAEVSDAIANASGEESVLPIYMLISLLDGYHGLTGLPWWIVIASSTVALRIALLPMLILQLQKLKRISELFPKLPPPLPPPQSGRSYIEQLSLFRKERRAIGCPSFLWFVAYFSIQVPCFLLWMTSIRRMSLDHHPGFDNGGALWFQNLTEFPHGVLGPIFPLMIACLHYTNVQISFRTSSIPKDTGLFGLLAKYYKFYLDLLTLPLIFICYCIPQGSLVYWITNSSLSCIQQLSLKHPAVRAKLGLPINSTPRAAAKSEEVVTAEIRSSGSPSKGRRIPVKDLSPKELLGLSVIHLSKGDKERAIPLLQLALDKDPGCVRAMVIMGQTLFQQGLLAEAAECLERAISKLFLFGHPAEVEDVDLLIQASQWAGVALYKQVKPTFTFHF
ncbi:ALBINO3-like protein 2, chloroplastic isoform X1 [Carica papaya]|uniref:ALBINO3-like protein 2, chloroplastic isoform X1 n=1 Tax=Carica papaya TaxID=3649 RepID=UPI000B8CC606|nr:ALBINO3-like protein 2, chloroplastic isoform X1 [Carica papaya]